MFNPEMMRGRVFSARLLAVALHALGPALVLVACGAEAPQSEDATSRAPDEPGVDQASPVQSSVEHPSEPAPVVRDKAVFLSIDPDFPGNCTREQQRIIAGDEVVALAFLDNIESSRANLLSTNPSLRTTQVFQLSFSTSALADRRFVLDTYRNINNVMENISYTCQQEGGPQVKCTDPDNGQFVDCCDVAFPGANAVASQPQRVLLCTAYFEIRSQTGRAQTLIHEASHHDLTGPDGEGTADENGLYQGVPQPARGIHTGDSYGNFAPRCTEGACF